jgi:hypothetical protein
MLSIRLFCGMLMQVRQIETFTHRNVIHGFQLVRFVDIGIVIQMMMLMQLLETICINLLTSLR